MINTITLTGADDSVHPLQLSELQNKYPFAELAILFSSKRCSQARYPSEKWVSNFFDYNNKFTGLSAHLCGDYAKAVLLGDTSFLQLTEGKFNRVQINHNFAVKPMALDKLYGVIESFPNIDFIIQKNRANGLICSEISKELFPNVNFLYDASGGRGSKIDFLGIPFAHHYTGYAGGLSPENIEAEILRINKFVEEIPVWLDMETHIRSNDDSLFDLVKCQQVLQIAEKYMYVDSD